MFFILLLAISKRVKLQKPYCAHLKDFLMKINFFFKFLAFLEAEISLIEAVGILISKVVSHLTFEDFNSMRAHFACHPPCVRRLLLNAHLSMHVSHPTCEDDNSVRAHFAWFTPHMRRRQLLLFFFLFFFFFFLRVYHTSHAKTTNQCPLIMPV